MDFIGEIQTELVRIDIVHMSLGSSELQKLVT